MSCASGIQVKNKVFIGVDSCAADDDSNTIRKDEKIFKKGKFLIAFVGSFRMFQVIRYYLKIPQQRTKDDFGFLCTTFVNSLRNCLKKNGTLIIEEETKVEGMEGSLLIGYKGRLYVIDEDFHVGVTKSGYDSIGSGSPYALGSLLSTENLIKDPEERIQLSLKSAATFSNSVDEPFKIMSIRR